MQGQMSPWLCSSPVETKGYFVSHPSFLLYLFLAIKVLVETMTARIRSTYIPQLFLQLYTHILANRTQVEGLCPQETLGPKSEHSMKDGGTSFHSLLTTCLTERQGRGKEK